MTYEVLEEDKDNIAIVGITKRELFAALAMNGIASSDMSWSFDTIGEFSVKIADNLIKALKETSND